MTGRPTGPAEAAGPSSFTSSPSDNGRAYRASGDQTIHEQHYHGSAPFLPPPSTSAPHRRKPALYALTGSLTAMAAVLVLLAGAGGTWLLLRSASSADTKAAAGPPRKDAPTAPATSVASSSVTPSASRSTTSSAYAPSAAAATSAKATATATAEPKTSPAPAAPRTQSASAPASWQNPAPDKQCRAWTAAGVAGVAGVETRPCWRRDGDRVFMIAEWRTTKGTALVDVHLWLKDKDGRDAVYPMDSTLEFPDEVASPQGTGKKQWVEQEIRTDLVRGAKYQVNVKVQPKGSTPPYVKNPEVDGAQVGFVY